MSRLHVSLRDVPSEMRCAKPECQTSHTALQRHHHAHPAVFFGVWAERRAGEEKFSTFIIRYNKFLPEDIVILCSRHHAEIHSIYDNIISLDRWKVGIPLAKYSWKQAERLMKKLSATCREWLEYPSPGMGPNELKRLRKQRGYYKIT